MNLILLLPAAGRKAYSLTWGLQYVNLFMINTGFIILAGEALKVKSSGGKIYLPKFFLLLNSITSESKNHAILEETGKKSHGSCCCFELFIFRNDHLM